MLRYLHAIIALTYFEAEFTKYNELRVFTLLRNGKK